MNKPLHPFNASLPAVRKESRIPTFAALGNGGHHFIVDGDGLRHSKEVPAEKGVALNNPIASWVVSVEDPEYDQLPERVFQDCPGILTRNHAGKLCVAYYEHCLTHVGGDDYILKLEDTDAARLFLNLVYLSGIAPDDQESAIVSEVCILDQNRRPMHYENLFTPVSVGSPTSIVYHFNLGYYQTL